MLKGETIFPDATNYVASNICTMQVLKGSHLLGRIDHKRIGGQTGADLDRVGMIEKVVI